MNPWKDLPSRPPFVIPADAPYVANFNAKSRPIHQLRLEIIPEPYLGNPTAPVVLLNPNPGFVETDRQVHVDPKFNAAARENLLHSRSRWPLYLLDPELPSPGQGWWKKRLKALIGEVGPEIIATQVFVAEVHGYHSIKYRHQRTCLPSQQYTFGLIRAAIARRAIFVVMRGFRIWSSLIPELREARLHRLLNPQNAAISPGNCPEIFDEIVRVARAAG